MMKKGVVLLVVCVLPFVWPEPTVSEIVWIKDVTTSFQTDKRTLSDLDLPDDLTFNLRHGSRALTLNLKRNHGIDPNADIYFVRKLNDGRQNIEKVLLSKNEDIAYYQDWENGAFMTVRCVRRSNGQCDRIINGNIRMDDINYDIRPAENEITSRDMLDNPDPRGTRYIRRLQANIQKDGVKVSEKNREQEFRNLHMSFPQEQVNPKHFPSLLTSRNVSHYHNGGEKRYNGKKDEGWNDLTAHEDDTRTLKNVYYVEIAVLIDYGAWDFYSSLFQTDHSTVEFHQVERDIRELFSHVINGASMLYRNIEDPSIAIRLSLREFYIFKFSVETSHELKYKHSVVTEIEGRNYIDALNYRKDVADWTGVYGAYSDHVMLFTKFDLYKRSPDKNDITGISYVGKVCDKFHKVSIVEAGEFFTTMSTAAHELGHNLGAVHDGEGKATACKAADSFIMSSKEADIDYHKKKQYSRNPWMFSNCSVTAFKETLRDKDCLANTGVYYDWKEWKHFIRKQPGEVYSTDRQCEFIHGQGSYSCSRESADICIFMKCRVPTTEKCMTEVVRTARGTSCGEDMESGLFSTIPSKRLVCNGRLLRLMHALTDTCLQ